MTVTNANINKMFRWLKDKRKSKGDKTIHKPENDYGFKKKHVILQETENGHSVIVKDDQTTFVYPPSFCRFHFRARMPTPVQNVRENSIHIYDEIQDNPCHTLELSSGRNDADVIIDARRASDMHLSLKNAVDVGPYLIVPINSSYHSDEVGHVYKLNNSENAIIFSSCLCDKSSSECTCKGLDTRLLNTCDMVKDTKVVLTRCVKSKTELRDVTNFQFLCSHNNECLENICSFSNDAPKSECVSLAVLDQSDRTWTPDFPTRLSGSFLKSSDFCAITSKCTELITEDVGDSPHSCLDLKVENDTCLDMKNDNCTCGGYDLNSSKISDTSHKVEVADYQLYLSKIETNLQLTDNIRQIVEHIKPFCQEVGNELYDGGNSITYVSSLEYPSEASHISDVSANNSTSHRYSGHYECTEDILGACEQSRVNLARSVSALETHQSTLFHVEKCHKVKDKLTINSKSFYDQRCKLFCTNVYRALSDKDKELYMFPSASLTNSSMSRRHTRSKIVLPPQPTPMYMDPYRGKSHNHNRLLGDLIRMNNDQQLFFH